MAFFDYGGGGLEDVLMKKMLPEQAGTIPQPGIVSGGDVTSTVAAPASMTDKIMKGLKDYGPLISQLGTALMRPVGPGAKGQETVGSQLGSSITSALESQKLNEALRKMVSGQLSGGGGGGFKEGQSVGLEGADVVGLTPDQISGIYGVGLKVRESELNRPIEAISKISDAYLKVMSGQAKPAEMEQHLAAAQKAYQEVAAAPAKNLVELLSKIQGMEKAQAEIQEIQTRISKAPTEKAKTEAETEKTKAETKKTKLESDPDFIELKRRLEVKHGPLQEIRRGNVVSLTNPASGKEVASYDIGATPETPSKAAATELPLKKFAMQRIAPLVVKSLEAEMSALPQGEQKVDLQNLLSSLRGYTGEIDPGVLLARASPELQGKFNRLMDIYIKTPGISESEFGNIVQAVLGTKSAEGGKPPESAKKGEGIIGKNIKTPEPAPAEQFTKQLTGKPAGTYESGKWRVKWSGTTITSIEPKQPAATAPNIYGTY